MGRILAIDYGQKRAGLAVTDELRLVAGALASLPAAEVLDYLREYIRNNEVDCFVVGEPRKWNNTPSESERFIGPFVAQLRKLFPRIPVERYDERFTSLIASRTILESGATKKKRQDKSIVDRVSAAIILQSFLESPECLKYSKSNL